MSQFTELTYQGHSMNQPFRVPCGEAMLLPQGTLLFRAVRKFAHGKIAKLPKSVGETYQTNRCYSSFSLLSFLK
jgi:hypothetical protein